LGQKCNPIGLRVGINRTWNSRWFDEKNFAEKLQEDLKIQKYIHTRLKDAAISDVIIERKTNNPINTLSPKENNKNSFWSYAKCQDHSKKDRLLMII